jgi:hypothetical protein
MGEILYTYRIEKAHRASIKPALAVALVST